jgi:hypothetical protein
VASEVRKERIEMLRDRVRIGGSLVGPLRSELEAILFGWLEVEYV